MPSALVVFTCRPNSHPFEERHVYVDRPVRIGRSVARSRPAADNATFDCKVLSRNHALVWFELKTGKFFLQDTRSSNGTFVNSQRLSRGGEESAPCEILTGDVVQFGVEVIENARKVTYGCIVSTVQLFLPDGTEVSKRSDVIQAPVPLPDDKEAASRPSGYSQELFQLSQYLKEALHRERMLEQKMSTLQRVLIHTQEATESSWQALVEEDRLLCSVEVIGDQLELYTKSRTEEGVRKELLALQEHRSRYENMAKEALRHVLQEKVEVSRRLAQVERSLSSSEGERTHLAGLKKCAEEQLRELANKYNIAVKLLKDLTDKLKWAELQQEEMTESHLKERKELQQRISGMQQREQVLQAHNDFTNARLTCLQVLLEQLQDKSRNENTSLEIQMDARECDMSDTLKPCKDISTEDFTDSQMDEQDLKEPLNKVALLNDDLQHGILETSDSEQVIQRLTAELREAQELATRGQQKCMELQGALEQERRESQVRSEEAARQIHALQVQLQKLQAEREVLREERESAVSSAHEELRHAQEEALSLRRAQEEALSLRRAQEAVTARQEREIAALQDNLGAVTAELEKWRQAAAEYEQETRSLKANLQELHQHAAQAAQLQGELQKECAALQKECAALRSEKTVLRDNLQHLEKELHSSRDQTAMLTRNVSTLERTQGELESRLEQQQKQQQQDSTRLRAQLEQAESRTKSLQKEYEQTQLQLCDLRQRCSDMEQEKQAVTEELQQCRSSLSQLQESAGRRGWLSWVSAVVVMVAAGVLYSALAHSSA
ncbi:sarcolemmal membrane-associated protein-like [Megalops cyprinoides]|uniref:sarcolemmal membrane-associated protein-like n=1 Tax=Megalops cyprinoides TaxID=118141 RepID=UPI001863DB6E|nr:sarcolemmal membrane-associated protein-like [Megalops cyprinoides]